jgi:hypothetical protein
VVVTANPGRSAATVPTHTSAAIVLALLVGIAVVLARGPWFVTAVLLGAAVVVSTFATTSDSVAPGFLLGVLAFGLVVDLPFSRAVRIIGTACVVYVSLRSWHHGLPGLTSALDDAVLVAALNATGSAFVSTLVRNVGEADRTHAARVDAELEESMERAVRHDLSSTRQVLHDDVIGALSAVMDGQAAPDKIRAACHRAAIALEQATPSEPSHDSSLRSVVTTAALEATVAVDELDAEDILLEPEVAGAVLRSLREVLRNAARHAGVDRVAVSVAVTGGEVVLTAHDRGVGFTRIRHGWGLENSVRRPMLEIGGRATVTGRPGAGTTVELRWPLDPASSMSDDLPRTHSETLAAVGGDGRLALGVALPILLAHSYIAARHLWGDPTALAQALVALAVVVGTVAVVGRLRQRALTRLQLIATGVTAGVATWVGLSLAESDALTGYDSWVIGLASVSVTIAAFFVPLRWVVVLGWPRPVARSTRACSRSCSVTCSAPTCARPCGRSLRTRGASPLLQRRCTSDVHGPWVAASSPTCRRWRAPGCSTSRRGVTPSVTLPPRAPPRC